MAIRPAWTNSFEVVLNIAIFRAQVKDKVLCECERTLVIAVDDERGLQLYIKVLQKSSQRNGPLRHLAHCHILRFQCGECYGCLVLRLHRDYPISKPKDVCAYGFVVVAISKDQ
jgi:hypothetical protein